MSSPPVQDSTAHRLLAVLAADQANAPAPSMVAGVVRDGSLVWSACRGSLVSVEDPHREPSIDTQYRIGSITKIMTAILVMQLRDDGVLRLTDRLDKHLPGVAYGGRTIRELLSHSSGMPAEPPGSWWERSPGVSIESLLAGLDEEQAPFPPGREYHYSNLAYALLGEVVARRRATSWMTSLQTLVLDPLEMGRTSYLADGPAATGYSVDPFTGRITEEPSHDSRAMAPAGQLWSTVEDLARLAAFLADPDPAVLSPDTVSEMTAGQTGSPDAVAAGSYGLGLRLAVVGDRSYLGHTGSVPGFIAGLFVDRARCTAAVCLANAASGVRAQGLPVELMQRLEQVEPRLPQPWTPTVEVPPAVRDVLGLWYWGNMAFTVSYQPDRLVGRLLSDHATWFTVRIVEGERLVGATGYFAGEPMHVVRRDDGSVGHLECATFIFTRIPYDPQAPIPGG